MDLRGREFRQPNGKDDATLVASFVRAQLFVKTGTVHGESRDGEAFKTMALLNGALKVDGTHPDQC